MPLQPPSPFHQHIALPERTALLLSMLAPWPRRGRELLVICEYVYDSAPSVSRSASS